MRRWLSRLLWSLRYPGAMSLDWLEQQDTQVREVYEGVCIDWPIQREVTDDEFSKA